MARLESLPGRVVAATLKFFANLGGAPCLAIVFVPKTAAHLDPEMAPQEAALAEAERLDRVESASALMQNLCLAAWDRGVGTCWMLAPRYAAKEIIEYLGLSDVELIAATPLGYPAHVPPGPARRPGRVMWLGFDD
jgi:nitroreductase